MQKALERGLKKEKKRKKKLLYVSWHMNAVSELMRRSEKRLAVLFIVESGVQSSW